MVFAINSKTLGRSSFFQYPTIQKTISEEPIELAASSNS